MKCYNIQNHQINELINRIIIFARKTMTVIFQNRIGLFICINQNKVSFAVKTPSPVSRKRNVWDLIHTQKFSLRKRLDLVNQLA